MSARAKQGRLQVSHASKQGLGPPVMAKGCVSSERMVMSERVCQ